MSWPRFAFLLCLAAIIQADLVEVFSISTAKPDLLLVLLAFFAIYSNTTESIIAAFAIGFASDLIGSSMGPAMLSYGICGTALAYLSRVLAVRKMGYQAVVIFILGILTGLMIKIFTLIKGVNVSPELMGIVLKNSIYSALIGPFLFLPSAWWMKVKTNRFRKI